MKNLMLLSFSLLLSIQTYAQDPNIIREWHLHNLIIDGEDHIPDHLTTNLYCEFYFESGADYFYFPTDIHLYSHHVDYGTSSDTFIMNEGAGLTDWLCHDDPCRNFFEIYRPFYFSYFGTIMSYEIIDNSNGSKTLIVTNIDGDQAIYNTEPLVLEITEYSQVSFVISPNPVSETLFITYPSAIASGGTRAENLPIENLTVFNLAGQTILSENRNVNELNVSSLSEGLYFLEITSEAGRQIQKFIKQN